MVKIVSGLAYIFFIAHGRLEGVFKIKDNFLKNPILYRGYFLKEEEKLEYLKNNIDNIDKIEEIFQTPLSNYDIKETKLTELIIYQIEE